MELKPKLKLVPFNDAWIDHGKLDIKAIYRRPRWTKDDFDQDVQETGPDGLPLWDLTGPLPIKQHNKWKAKGFEYVTLADRDSLIEAYRKNTLLPHGTHAREYDQHQTGGPWNAKMYMAGQSTADNATLLQLRESVQRYGSEVYTNIRREIDPKFSLPSNLRDIEPGGELPPLVPTKGPAQAPWSPNEAAAAATPKRRRQVTAAGKTTKPKKTPAVQA